MSFSMRPPSPPAPAQASVNTWAPRVRTYANAFITPVIQPTAQNALSVRTTKRGTTAINYAEDGYDDDDFDSSDGPRRPTGLRSMRREDSNRDVQKESKLGQEIYSPVKVQGIQRDWLAKNKSKKSPYVSLYPPFFSSVISNC
jgi:chromatin structure-remodeling complex subunit SFH1